MRENELPFTVILAPSAAVPSERMTTSSASSSPPLVLRKRMVGSQKNRARPVAN